MNFFSGMTTEYPTELYRELLRYRYRIFVEKLGWNVPTKDGMEFDEFDRDDTVYVTARDPRGRINGCTRLLPTSKPYLLAEVFPQLMNGRALPRRDDVWELSRFAAHSPNLDATVQRNCFLSPAASKLLHYSIEDAARRGAKNLVFVSTAGMEGLMRRDDINVRSVGPSRVVGGHRVSACWIDI
jgi:N-acyl-L-homoserine lactone synthetase